MTGLTRDTTNNLWQLMVTISGESGVVILVNLVILTNLMIPVNLVILVLSGESGNSGKFDESDESCEFG